jgi:hypothetical protein
MRMFLALTVIRAIWIPFPRRITLVAIGLSFAGSLTQAQAGSSVTLAWNPAGSTDVAGYHLYYGTSSGIYSQILSVGNKTTATVSNLALGQTYYFVVTDYSSLGLESGPSNEVSTTIGPNSTASATSPTFPVLTNFVSGSGDFNGDGKEDILWRNTQSGEVHIWYMEGATIAANDYVDVVGLDWKIIAIADFNGDGFADILWVNTVDGSFAIWLMRGDAHVSYQFPSPGFVWSITGVADLDHTGMADILWRNLATGEVRVWRSVTPLNFSSQLIGTASPDWQLVGTADLDGDAHPRLIWRSQISGEVRAWKVSGGTITANERLGIAPLEWRIIGFGDLTGDGHHDIVWQNDLLGIAGAWIMNRTAITAQWFVPGVSPGWRIRATPDVNGDHVNSLLWSNTATGNQVIWASNGSSLQPAPPFGLADPSWVVQPSGFDVAP